MTIREPIVLATSNPKKVHELREIMGKIGVEIIPLADLGMTLVEPEETGATFEENARIKALGYAEQTGRFCLADDSGLVVDALDGAPGVYSARYSSDIDARDLPREQRDLLNNKKLLDALGDKDISNRQARFVCAMCLAGPDAQASCGGGFQPPSNPDHPRSFSISDTGDLPHWRLTGSTYFVTFRLHGGSLTSEEQQITLEACLHQHGSRCIFNIITIMPDHVHLVLRLLDNHEGKETKLSSVLHSIKSFSANTIHKLRGSKGRLWQRESYDRIIRDERELLETIGYVEMNAVRQGLVSKPGEYPWTCRESSLKRRLEASATGIGAETRVRVLAESTGTFEGVIGMPNDIPRGSNGFGYDPIFLAAPEFSSTSAELSPEIKNSLSHRGKASRLMADQIQKLQK